MPLMQDPRDQAMQSTKEFAAKEAKAKADNLAREKEIRGIYDSIISRYEPGGAFEQSQLQQLGVQRAQGVGQATQNLVSSGLFNTTKAAGVGNAWERDVGIPARMRLEDIMTTRRNEAQGEKAGFIERISNAYPSTDPLMAAAGAQGFADQYGAAGGGGSSGGMKGFESLTPGNDPVLAYSGPAAGSGSFYQGTGAQGMGSYDAYRNTQAAGAATAPKAPIAGTNPDVRYTTVDDSAYAAPISNVGKTKPAAGGTPAGTVIDSAGNVYAPGTGPKATIKTKSAKSGWNAQTQKFESPGSVPIKSGRSSIY